MSFRFHHHTLFFHKPAATSRDVLQCRDVYYLLAHSIDNNTVGVGECAPIWGLSPETKAEIERIISNWPDLISQPGAISEALVKMSSLRFALETALRDLAEGGQMNPFKVDLSRPIPINGLVWMSDAESMFTECRAKVEAGFHTIKFKVGALRFDEELDLLNKVRREFHQNDLEIRLDANGAFKPEDALDKLDALSNFRIHSIEQPIRAGNWQEMAELVRRTPIAIALDEELIGVHDIKTKQLLLDTICPHYLVLKPSLHGAFSGCDEWIELAENRNMGWWATSALESNIGLNAIAQWLLTKRFTLPQGLGTGGLFSNNIESPWLVDSGYLRYDSNLQWNLKPILK
jgi:o-succinylbenzoate synthase